MLWGKGRSALGGWGDGAGLCFGSEKPRSAFAVGHGVVSPSAPIREHFVWPTSAHVGLGRYPCPPRAHPPSGLHQEPTTLPLQGLQQRCEAVPQHPHPGQKGPQDKPPVEPGGGGGSGRLTQGLLLEVGAFQAVSGCCPGDEALLLIGPPGATEAGLPHTCPALRPLVQTCQ